MNILDEIIAYKEEFVKNSKKSAPFLELVKKIEKNFREPRFKEKIKNGPVKLIAEIKKASPSKGIMKEDFDPASIASFYKQGGAGCLSVLTDEKFFQGKLEDLDVVISSVDLPVLRKDFIINEYQIYESKAHGADAILLIAAALKASEMKDMLSTAKENGLDVLVEVHNRDELVLSLDCGAEIIGINTRNLKDFTIDLKILKELAEKIPPGKLRVSESGIRTIKDLDFLRGLGFNAVLIGEALMSAQDIAKATREFSSSIEKL